MMKRRDIKRSFTLTDAISAALVLTSSTVSCIHHAHLANMARQRSLTTETNLATVQTNLATIQIRPTPREIAQCYHLIPFKALR